MVELVDEEHQVLEYHYLKNQKALQLESEWFQDVEYLSATNLKWKDVKGEDVRCEDVVEFAQVVQT